MARNEWRGDALAVAGRERFTIAGTPAAGNTVTITCNRKVVTYTVITADTVALVAAGLAAAWAAATFPETADANVEYTDGNAYLELVSANPGVPFTVTAGATGGGATNTKSTITAASGPNHVDLAANWTANAVPTTGDAVVVSQGGAMLYGFGSAITCDTWEFRPSYTEPVGLPAWNPAGYWEYRTRALTIDAPAVTVDAGSSRMILRGVASSTWVVNGTGTREDAAYPALDLGATGNVSAVKVAGGDVGILFGEEGTARTIAAVSVTGDETVLTAGRDLTVTALDFDRGTVTAYGTVTTLTMGDGDYTQAAGTLTNLNTYGGRVKLNHAGTVAAVVAKGRGDSSAGPVIDCTANNLARTFTDSDFSGGASLLDGNKSVTLDAGGTHSADAAFFALSDLGPQVTWNRT